MEGVRIMSSIGKCYRLGTYIWEFSQFYPINSSHITNTFYNSPYSFLNINIFTLNFYYA